MKVGVSMAVALVLSMTGNAWSAETLDEREQAVHDAARARDEVHTLQQGKTAEAVRLADEIARLKAQGGALRAGGELERRLRAFDRMADDLDALDRRLDEQSATLTRARAAFEEAADRLGRGQPDVEAARARVRSAASPAPAFRPPLDVRPAAEDGPMDIEGKLQLLEAERLRITGELTRIDAEDRVIEERLAQKRRLAQQAGAARRDAGSAFASLAGWSDDLRREIARLTREHDEHAQARALRRDALALLAARTQEMSARRTGAEVR